MTETINLTFRDSFDKYVDYDVNQQYLKGDFLHHDGVSYWATADNIAGGEPASNLADWLALSENPDSLLGSLLLPLSKHVPATNTHTDTITAGTFVAFLPPPNDRQAYVRGQYSDRLFQPRGFALTDIAAGESGNFLVIGATDVILNTDGVAGEKLYHNSSDGSISTDPEDGELIGQTAESNVSSVIDTYSVTNPVQDSTIIPDVGGEPGDGFVGNTFVTFPKFSGTVTFENDPESDSDNAPRRVDVTRANGTLLHYFVFGNKISYTVPSDQNISFTLSPGQYFKAFIRYRSIMTIDADEYSAEAVSGFATFAPGAYIMIRGTVDDGDERLLMYFISDSIAKSGQLGFHGYDVQSLVNIHSGQRASYFSGEYTDLNNTSESDDMVIRITSLELVNNIGLTRSMNEDGTFDVYPFNEFLTNNDHILSLDMSPTVGGGLMIQRFQSA